MHVCSQQKWDSQGFESSVHFISHALWWSYYSPFLPLMSCFDFLPPLHYFKMFACVYYIGGVQRGLIGAYCVHA